MSKSKLDNITVFCTSFMGELYIGRIGKEPGLALEQRPAEPEIMNAVIGHMMYESPKGSSKVVTTHGKKYEVSVMPVQDVTNNGTPASPEAIAALRSAFLPLQNAAIVPAVHISRYQWASICDIISTLSDLHESCPNGLRGAIIQGSLLADIALAAAEISHLATVGEISSEQQAE